MTEDKSDSWQRLLRNARDAGASSVLASQILQKTVTLLDQGAVQINRMAEASRDSKKRTDELTVISESIKQVAQQSKIVSINAGIEANRAGEQGRTFQVVAHQMTALSEDVRNFTGAIDQKIASVNASTIETREICERIESLMRNMRTELTEFSKLMSRVEHLSAAQSQQIEDIKAGQ